MRTLRRPERHGYHLPWLRRVREAVAGLDLSELWLLMPGRGGYTPDFLGPPPQVPYAPFEEELTRMRATDPAVAHRELVLSLDCTPGAADTPHGRAMLTDPARAVQRLADLTERAWQALVAPDWPRLRALLEADIAYRSRQPTAVWSGCSRICGRACAGPTAPSPSAPPPSRPGPRTWTAGGCC